jgi:hypothetical protein
MEREPSPRHVSEQVGERRLLRRRTCQLQHHRLGVRIADRHGPPARTSAATASAAASRAASAMSTRCASDQPRRGTVGSPATGEPQPTPPSSSRGRRAGLATRRTGAPSGTAVRRPNSRTAAVLERHPESRSSPLLLQVHLPADERPTLRINGHPGHGDRAARNQREVGVARFLTDADRDAPGIGHTS